MAEPIHESGMDFISDNTFNIEKTSRYSDFGKGTRSVDFVRIKDNNLLFVEAKTTFTNPNNPDIDNINRFSKSIYEMCEKFIHSLNLFSSIHIGIRKDNCFDSLNIPEEVSLFFVLVVRDHKTGWCKPIRREIENSLPTYFKKIWKPHILVVNSEEAALLNFVISNQN